MHNKTVKTVSSAGGKQSVREKKVKPDLVWERIVAEDITGRREESSRARKLRKKKGQPTPSQVAPFGGHGDLPRR